MTSITEITRNGAKSARGLVSIQSRLNQIVDESSSTGKALSEWYQQHNIEIYDQAGQLRSLYDVMEDVSKIWGTLTTNEKDYYLNQQAGANQSQNLAALLSNFTAAQEAYGLALNSAGSAMKENAAYAESLEFKQNQLNASFQEMANNLIDSDVVGVLLDVVNGLIQLDNATGNLVSSILILTGIGWGGTQLLRVSKLIPVITSQFTKFKEVIDLVAGGAGTLKEALAAVGDGTSALSGFFSSSLPVVLAISAAITLLVAGVKLLADATDKANRSMADFDKEIESANSQLQTNQDRLKEINEIPWNERTADIIKERQELEAENAALEEQIRLLNEEKIATAEKRTGEGFQFGFTEGGEAYDTMLQYLDDYTTQIEQTGEILDEQRLTYDKTVAAAANQVEMLKLLKDSGHELTDQEEQLIAAYETHMRTIEILSDDNQTLIDAYTSLSNAGYLTEQQYQRLISLYPQLASMATQTADGYVLQQSALESLMSAETRQQAQVNVLISGFVNEAKQAGYTGKALYDLVAAQIQASNTGLNFSQQIAALQQLAIQAGYTASYVNNVLGAGLSNSNIERTAKGLMQTGKYKNYDDALAEAQRRAQSALSSQWSKLTSVAPSGGWSGSSSSTYASSSSSSASSAADTAKQAQIKALQNERDQIQDTIDAINDKYDAELEAIEDVNDALEDEIELQKILEEMAEAKASKKMVYKDGRFQYVSDLDAVASAQLKLDEYNRKKALKDQKADIERRRQLELQAYNDRLDIIDKNLKALQSGFNSELSAWDDYLEQLQQKIEAEEALKKRQSSGGGYTYTPASSSTISSVAGSTADKVSSGVSNALNNAINSVNSAISKITGKTTTGSSSNYNKWTNTKAGSIISSVTGTKQYGNGGRASGTMSAPAGLTLVGEQGPELRVLNQGDGILPANITRNLWAMASNPQMRNNMIGGNTSNTAINVANITLPNVRNAEDFIAGLKNMAYQRAYARA